MSKDRSREFAARRVLRRRRWRVSAAFGASSSEYFDKCLFDSDPHLLREIAESIAHGLIAGITYTGGT